MNFGNSRYSWHHLVHIVLERPDHGKKTRAYKQPSSPPA